jgi:hypothetical protein
MRDTPIASATSSTARRKMNAAFVEQTYGTLLVGARKERELSAQFALDGIDQSVHRTVQRRKPHASDDATFPDERYIGLTELVDCHDGGTECGQERLHRLDERMLLRHERCCRATLTLTNVAPLP